MIDDTAVQVNKQWFAGDSHWLQCTVLDLNYNAVSLVGAAIVYNLRLKDAFGAVQFTKNLTSGIVVSGASNNILTISINPVDTVSLVGTYYHECQVTLVDGTVLTPFYGEVDIVESGA